MAVASFLVAYFGLGLLAQIGIAKEVEIRMPNVRPLTDDEYMCHSFKLDQTPVYIKKFSPHANMETAHHMLLYGCTEPGSDKPTWNCGEMDSKQMKELEAGPVCQSGSTIVYAWAMDAPGLMLPEGISIKVGDGTGIKYLVLQIHYKNTAAFKKSESLRDNSGLTLTTQTTHTPKLAGIYLLGTDGSIPAQSTVYMETACTYSGRAPIHPLAFRTHTHKLGKVVSGYRIHNGVWTEIGRMSPQKPQMFYNVTDPSIVVNPGDVLAARCVMKNDGTKSVAIGNTQKDEMCNFYLMYWVDAKDEAQLNDLENRLCFSQGWPNFKWSDLLDLSGLPATSAMIPESNEIIREMVAMEKMQQKMFDDIENMMEQEEPKWDDARAVADPEDELQDIVDGSRYF